MKRRFLEILDEEVLLCDGAMGTLLNSVGVPFNARDEQNLVNPDLVRRIHTDYINAGARIIETNTFSANRIKLRNYGLLDRIEEINRGAVRIAKEAVAGRDLFIAGSVGPLGALVKPYGNLTIEELGEIYAEQVRFLAQEGVDLIIVETHPSLLETLEALNAVRSCTDLPVVTSMTFLSDGRTTFGDEFAVSMEALASAGSDVVGLNCTLGPKETYDLIEGFISKTDLKVFVMPNAGYPTVVGGKNVFLSSPEYLREYARLYVESGASIVGGCCGTTPEHIKAMSQVVKGQRPRRKRIYAVSQTPAEVRRKEVPERDHETKIELRFTEKLGKEFVVAVEMSPPKGLDYSKLKEGANAFLNIGVDAVTIGDGPIARVRMSPVSLAHLIQEEVGIETILHFACRDKDLVVIQSDLLGAAALCIRNVLVLTGDPVSVGDFPKPSSVFAVSSAGLVRIMKGMNQGFDLTGMDLGRTTRFKIGVAVNFDGEDLEKGIHQLAEKIEAGADFAQTQAVYDVRTLERFIRKVEGFGLPILVSVLPLKSSSHAEFLNNEVPGISIPQTILRRMHSAADKEVQVREGMAIARELIREIRSMAAGLSLLPAFDRYDLVAELLSN